MTDRNFKFFETFWNAINLLPEGEREKACYEFCKFGITGELPKETSLAMFCLGVNASVHKYQGRGGYREGSGRKKSNNQNNQKNQKNQKNHNAQTETETETETKTETKTEFDLFFNQFPKQVDEYKTFTLFDTLINEKIVTFDELMQGVKRYKEYTARAGTDEKFIKSPFNWLSDMSWKNKYEVKNEKPYRYNAFA